VFRKVFRKAILTKTDCVLLALTGTVLCVIVLAIISAVVSPTTPPSTTTAAHIDETATILQMRPCSPTKEALDEVVKWSVLHDEPEFNRTMRTTHSFVVEAGMRVKVLDSGFATRKIRVLTNTAGEDYLKDEQGVFAADPRIGRECWVDFEALGH
jgi:hypothetical protein